MAEICHPFPTPRHTVADVPVAPVDHATVPPVAVAVKVKQASPFEPTQSSANSGVTEIVGTAATVVVVAAVVVVVVAWVVVVATVVVVVVVGVTRLNSLSSVGDEHPGSFLR